jgi:hypothetical protein
VFLFQEWRRSRSKDRKDFPACEYVKNRSGGCANPVSTEKFSVLRQKFRGEADKTFCDMK